MHQSKSKDNNTLLTFGGHLEVLRRMLFRIITVTGTIAVVIFCFKDTTWQLLLAPNECSFTTYRWIENTVSAFGFDFHFEEFRVDLIATDLSSQFMTHITTSVYLGLLGASPYILYELFRFVSPALYENEKKYYGNPVHYKISASNIDAAFEIAKLLAHALKANNRLEGSRINKIYEILLILIFI